MKFIKRKNIDTYKPKSQRFTVEVDGRAIINTDKSVTVPLGDTAARPGTGVPGMLRYNTQTSLSKMCSVSNEQARPSSPSLTASISTWCD